MLLSYYNLTVNVGEVKWLRNLAAGADAGITQADFDAAELWARDKINLFLIDVAGETRGGAVVAEFLAMASNSTVDPVIRHLAELLAAAKILRQYESRAFIDQGAVGGDQLRRRDWQEVHAEAIALGNKIGKTKKTIKADGTVRRLGMGRGQQGPMVNGPMTSGSHFSDRGTYTDVLGQSWALPHVPPIEQASG